MALNEQELQAIKDGTAKAFGTPSAAAAPVKPAEPAKPPVEPAQPATPVAATEPATPVKPIIDYDAISEEDRDEMLAKLTGGKVKSFASLQEPAPKKSKEEIEAEEKQEKQDALAWAIENKFISREDYDKGIVDKSKSDRDISKAILAEEMREDNPDVTDEEVEQYYSDMFHEDKEEKSPVRIAALKKEAKIAAQYKKEKYGKLDTIDSEYQNFRSEASAHKSYTKQVKTVLDGIPKESTIKVPIKISDTDPGTEIEVKYTMDDADIKAVRDMMNDPGVFNVLKTGKGEVKDEAILKMAQYHMTARIAQKQMDTLLKSVALDAIKATLAWNKNIPVTKAPIATTTVFPANGASGGKTPPSHAPYHERRN